MGTCVLIIPDKFKGTLSAPEAANAIARGWGEVRPDDPLELLPMSDGGDGFGETLKEIYGAEPQQVRTVDAAHRPIEASWWWAEGSRTGIIESASVIGLARLPKGHYHPFLLDTFGLGMLFRQARENGARRLLIGIGGSATNDAGFGLARSLGWQFRNRHHDTIYRWTDLANLHRIEPPSHSLLGRARGRTECTVAVDVQNPLLGSKGATRVYGPQKGLTQEQDILLAERCLGRLAEIVSEEMNIDAADVPGSGAAGGLGFGLQIFTGANLVPGFELFAQKAGLKDRLERASLVITGEGSLDRSTLMGKGVGEVARLAHEHNIPVIGLGGLVSDRNDLGKTFDFLGALTPDLTSSEEAEKNARRWLRAAASAAARKWQEGKSS